MASIQSSENITADAKAEELAKHEKRSAAAKKAAVTHKANKLKKKAAQKSTKSPESPPNSPIKTTTASSPDKDDEPKNAKEGDTYTDKKKVEWQLVEGKWIDRPQRAGEEM